MEDLPDCGPGAAQEAIATAQAAQKTAIPERTNAIALQHLANVDETTLTLLAVLGVIVSFVNSDARQPGSIADLPSTREFSDMTDHAARSRHALDSSDTLMSTHTPPRTRTRLDPEARQTQILDHAARLVATEGLSGVTMERIAREAGVSKALVYTYFSNQTNLMRSLLRRDLERVQREHMHAAMTARTFPELVRNTTHIALVEVEKRGAFVRRLLNEPSLSDAEGAVRTHEHDANARYLARKIAREFDISTADALRLTEVGLGLTIAACDYLQKSGAPRQGVEDMTVAMILGAVKAGAAQCRRKSRRAPKS